MLTASWRREFPGVSDAISIVEKGGFRFQPLDDQKGVPSRYRLEPRDFAYEMERKNDLPAVGVSVFRVRFPSPVASATPCPE